MSEKENVVIEVTEILDENTESTDKQYIDENIDDLQNKVFNQIGLTVLDNKLKKKVKIQIKEKINRVLSFSDLSPIRSPHVCNSLEDFCGVTKKFPRVSYLEIRDQINHLYFDDNEYYSSSMDILATYVRGQKIIYMESKYFSNVRLNYLMLPAIFLSSLATVFSLAFDIFTW